MKLLADESVDALIVERLRGSSHEVTYVAELAPGVDDAEVLARANADQAVLLTADKDFGELVFRQRLVHAGVVLIRLAGLGADRKATIMEAAIDRHSSEFADAFSVVSPAAVRIRHRIEHKG